MGKTIIIRLNKIKLRGRILVIRVVDSNKIIVVMDLNKINSK